MPLGRMLIKSHHTVTFVLYSLATYRWGTSAVAALIVAFSTALATLAFGPRVRVAFLQGASVRPNVLTQ